VPSWNLPGELRKRIGAGEVGWAVQWASLTPEQRELQATKMAIHAAMIDRMDREIGRVLGQLRSMGTYRDTVILFVSDNGASAEQIIRGDEHDPAAPPGSWRTFLCLGPGWSTAANTPFRLHKSWVHEGGISSPLIAHGRAGLRARASCAIREHCRPAAHGTGAGRHPHRPGRTSRPPAGEAWCLVWPPISCSTVPLLPPPGNRALRV
jgi:arylsulfatase